jgi:hypothetical protein
MTTALIKNPVAVRVGKTVYPFVSFADASIRFEAARDAVFFDGGSSADIPRVDLLDESGKSVGYISQNGRVWIGNRKDWKQNVAVYEPRRESQLQAA